MKFGGSDLGYYIIMIYIIKNELLFYDNSSFRKYTI